MNDRLTAAAFDALQFGADFKRRAQFRVDLAERVNAVVDAYVPPEGALDAGPRAIFATTVVEQWLREHGFPKADQHRWVDVAHDPRWGGAEELCEIDCGTESSLLVQLLVERDGDRQRIGEVRVGG